jgi:hypothetical protein
MQRHHVAIAVTIACIIGTVWYFMRSPVATAPTPPVPDVSENSDDAPVSGNPTIGVRMGEYGLYVPDQVPGNTVTVPMVSLGAPGFVVIVASENPSSIRGVSTRIDEGQHDLITVPLTRASVHGEKLEAQLYIDTGDGRFDRGTDQPARDPLDAPITMPFEISNDADHASEVVI